MNSGSQVNGGHILGVCLLKAGGVEVEFDKGTVTTVIAFFLKKVVPTPASLVLSLRLVNLVSSLCLWFFLRCCRCAGVYSK